MAEPPACGAAAEPGITITRVFDAPRERVWREWTEPERFADWFGGEAEVPVSRVSMDVREGGAWRATMFVGPGRHEIHWKGQYREVVAPKRLVFTISDQPGDDDYELVVVVLSSTSAPGKGGRPSSTAWRSTWPTPDPAGASAYRVLDLDGTRRGQ